MSIGSHFVKDGIKNIRLEWIEEVENRVSRIVEIFRCYCIYLDRSSLTSQTARVVPSDTDEFRQVFDPDHQLHLVLGRKAEHSALACPDINEDVRRSEIETPQHFAGTGRHSQQVTQSYM